MKQRYSYLLILVISAFSMRSISCAGRSDTDVQKDFAFIMQSLRASKYQEALEGKNERRGIKKFNKKHPVFDMQDEQGNTMLHAAVDGLYDVQEDGNKTTRIEAIEEIVRKQPMLLAKGNAKNVVPVNDALERKKIVLPLACFQNMDKFQRNIFLVY